VSNRCNGRCACLSADLELAHAEIARLKALLNTPQTRDWCEAVKVEAAHQRERWGADHDAGKTPADWFWLVGYLAGKALAAAYGGDEGSFRLAMHHTISAGAALANWHAALSGADTRMRPGIDPVERGIEEGT
jgi:hypothetical protein